MNGNDKLFVGGFSIGASPDTIIYSRAIYTLLDLLGDVGGLIDALKLICSMIIAVISNGDFSNYIISKLFYSYEKTHNNRESDYTSSEVPQNLNHA